MSVSSPTTDDSGPLAAASWLLMILGALCAIVGGVVLAKPDDSLTTLAVIVGIFLFLDGCIELAVALGRNTEGRGLVALLGVLNVIVGIALVRHPFEGVAAIALLIGIWLVARGVVRFVQAFGTGEFRMWNVIVAVIEVAAGAVILVEPDIGFKTLALLVGLSFIVRGVAIFAFGWALHVLRRAETAPPREVGATA